MKMVHGIVIFFIPDQSTDKNDAVHMDPSLYHLCMLPFYTNIQEAYVLNYLLLHL